MPPIERTDFNDRMVVWEYVRGDRNDEPIVLAPVELPCRWEDSDLEVPNPFGSNIDGMDSMIATIVQIRMNSIVWKGTLQNLEAYPKQIPPFDICEVILRATGTDLKGRDNRYEYGLRRYKNKPSFTIYTPPE